MYEENVVFIHNGILPTKKNAVLSFTGKWMELENIILSKVSQVQKAKSCMFSLIWGMTSNGPITMWVF
jgi:hypothetical protein